MITVSSIAYQNKEIPKARNHPFNSQFQLAMESFQERGISIGDKHGIENVFEDTNEYSKYKELMFGDIANEDTKAILGELLDRDRNLVLHDEQVTDESGSVGNVTTFAYLNGPVLRAIWARCIVPALMRVVALKQPTYTMTFDLPYIVDGSVRKNLPYSMMDGEWDDDSDTGIVIGLRKLVPLKSAGAPVDENTDGVIVFADGKAVGNLIDLSIAGAGLNPSGVPHTKYDGRSVDRRIFIKNIRYTAADSTTQTYPMTLSPSSKQGKAGDVLFMGELVTKNTTEDEPATFICAIDLSTGRFRATSTSADILSFEFDAYLSPEDNRTPVQMKQEQHSLEVMIGAGQHVMIDTPVELLQEYPTSHQGSDYVVTLTDIASETFAGNMNVQMLNFFKNSIKRPASASYIPQDVLKGVNIADAQFDIRVAHGENPAAYVDIMLKKCISYYIGTVQAISRIEDGYWNMVGHRVNVMQVPDFKTEGFAQLNGDADEKRDDVYGFKVGYVFGFTTNVINGKVRCLYTPEIQKSTGLLSFMTSVDDKRPTYIFHPFSYTVSRGYMNPNNNLVPTLMVTKRHTFQEFVPSAIRIELLGNDGTQFTQPRAPTTPTQTVAAV
jgi:hypothetical protein